MFRSKSLNDGNSIQKCDISFMDRLPGFIQQEPTDYDWVNPPWTVGHESMNNGSTYRKLYYEMRLNYVKRIGKHEMTGFGSFQSRQ